MKNSLLASIILVGLSFIFSCENSTSSETSLIQDTETIEHIDTTNYLQKGQEITQATFNVLSSNLQQAMGNGGVPEAINFCSIKAQPLTDSLSNYYKVSIKRTSHKIRNPLNTSTEQESVAIESFLTGNKTPFTTENEDGSVSYYAPIYTKGMCLICHGEKGSSMLENDYNIILEKYPDDKAINFSLDELRGIWSLIFKPENNE